MMQATWMYARNQTCSRFDMRKHKLNVVDAWII
jgi:hypothetical protein